MTTTTERRAYSVKELAAAWGISPRTVYDLIRAGDLKAFRTGTSRCGDGRGAALAITVAEIERFEAVSAREVEGVET